MADVWQTVCAYHILKERGWLMTEIYDVFRNPRYGDVLFSRVEAIIFENQRHLLGKSELEDFKNEKTKLGLYYERPGGYYHPDNPKIKIG